MKIKLSLGLLIILIFTSLPLTAFAGTSDTDTADKVLIYMIDKLNIDDIDPELTPNIWFLKEKGGLGLLNPVTSGGRTSKNICCTISAGKHAVASDKAQLNFKADEIINSEKAADIFHRNTGTSIGEKNIAINSIEVIKKNNDRLNTGNPGKLGDEIQRRGYQTVVIGNSDRPGYYSRLGALILMNSQGIIDDGTVGREVLQIDDTTGLKYQSDYSAIIAQSLRFKDIPAVVLIEFGDLNRLESMYNFFSPAKYQSERKKTLSQIDNCIGELQKKAAAEETCIYLITPSPSRTAVTNDELLLPIIVVKPGIKGTLTSFSTHREGVVSTINIKNSILSCLDHEINQEIAAAKATKSLAELKDLNKKAGFNHSNQTWIISIYIFLVLALLLLVSLQYIFKKSNNFTPVIITFISALPLSLLIMSKTVVYNPSLFIIESLFINLLIVVISWVITRIIKTNPLLPVLLLSIGVISIDLTANAGLIENSIMSYQLISGIRYYGLGNEYMGVLLGTAICFSALLLQNSAAYTRQIFIIILFCLVAFLTAYPLFGSNVGGAITASLGLGYTFLRFKEHTIDIKKVFLLILGTAIFISIIVFIDINQPVELQSHLGKNISLIISGGIGEIFNIIIRKLQMHLGLINYHFGGWILLLTIFIFTYLLFSPKNWFYTLNIYSPKVYAGLQGILLTAFIAILFNDSGIVAAAVLFLYFVILLLQSLIKIP